MNQGIKKMLKGFWIGTGRFTINVLVALLLLINQGALREAMAADPSPESLINCDIQQGPCTKEFSGMTVTLDIQPKPVKAMKELTFSLSLSGGEWIDNPYIDLSMPGMDMGPNRVLLKRVGNSGYEGRGVVVKCPSGRRTWKATVTLPGARVVEFVFDVVY